MKTKYKNNKHLIRTREKEDMRQKNKQTNKQTEQDTILQNTYRTLKMDHNLKREKLSDYIKKQHPALLICKKLFQIQRHKDTKRHKDVLCLGSPV